MATTGTTTGTTTGPGDPFAALTTAVAAERDAAGTVASRLAAVRRLLEAGRPPLLADGLARLELATARLEAVAERREEARRQLAYRLGLPLVSATLGRLAARAPEPWARQLRSHQGALVELAARIGDEAAAYRVRALRALDDVRDRLGHDPAPVRIGTPARMRERQLVDDLDLAALVTELRIREVTYEGLVEVTDALLSADLPAFVGSPSPAD